MFLVLILENYYFTPKVSRKRKCKLVRPFPSIFGKTLIRSAIMSTSNYLYLIKSFLPLHVFPFPVYPYLHWHL